MKRALAVLLACLLCIAISLPLVGEKPATSWASASPGTARIWIAWLDGKDLDRAWAAGAVVLDRFPDAFLVADASSAAALAAAGFRVEGPVDLTPGKTVMLVRARVSGPDLESLDAATVARQGVRIAWRGGRDLVTESDGPLPEDGTWLRLDRKVMTGVPARRPFVREAAKPGAGAVEPRATVFDSMIQGMVDQVDSLAYMPWIANLAGTNPVTIHGSPFTFTTRYTPTAQCDSAERYVYEQFQGMGFTDVQYDPYTFPSTSARNVVATLPGLVNPQRIYILCGHLDSRSPQPSTLAPGANDNASGVAAVLAAAKILRSYPFACSIRFIAFTGEEQGLYGSTHYAQAAAARGDSILGVVNCDMIAWHSSLYQIDIEGETAWQPLMTVMQDACNTYTGLATQMLYASWGSDHVPFQQQGFPAFLAIESEYDLYSCYHRTCDTTWQNQAYMGVEVTRACLATIAQLAGPLPLYIAHQPLPATIEDPVGPYEVVATILEAAPLVPDSLLLHWSQGWSYITSPLAPTGVPGQYHAFIPGRGNNVTISYYLTAADSAGRQAAHPAGAPASVHEFYVGMSTTLLFENFESGATGWSHGGTQDEWQLDSPRHLAEDPASAYSGTMVYGTDLTGLGTQLGKYENSAECWLESPAVNCTGRTGVKLSFRRWLAIDRSNGGTYDYARVLVNGTTIWESPSGANLIDTSWIPQQFDISALADGNASVKVRFTLHSNGTLVYGGWNLDDVELRGIDTSIPSGIAETSLPRRPRLYANWPNPFNPSTTLRVDLPAHDRVELSIYDAGGRLVRTLARGPVDAGTHTWVWDGRDADGRSSASGVYFCRLEWREARQSRRMVLIR